MNNKKHKAGVYEQIAVLEALKTPKTDIYYIDECMSDYKDGVFTMYIFTRTISLVKTKKGDKYRIEDIKSVQQISGKTKDVMNKALEDFINETEGEISQEEHNNPDWMPDKWLNIKKAVKLFNLLQN